jgi:hypothetical protein
MEKSSNITKSPAKQLRTILKKREHEQKQTEKPADVLASNEQQPALKPLEEDPEEQQLSKYIKDPKLIYKMKQRDFDALYGPFLRGCRIDLAVFGIVILTAFCLFDAGSMSSFWECDEAQLSNVTLPTYVFLCSRPHTYPPSWIFNFQVARSAKFMFMIASGVYTGTNHTMEWIKTGQNEELAFERIVDYSNHIDHLIAKQEQALLHEQERMKRMMTGDSDTKYVPFEKRMNVIGETFAEMRKNGMPSVPSAVGNAILDKALAIWFHGVNILVNSGRLPFLIFIFICYYAIPTLFVYSATKPLVGSIFRHWKYVGLLIENKLFYWFGMRI